MFVIGHDAQRLHSVGRELFPALALVGRALPGVTEVRSADRLVGDGRQICVLPLGNGHVIDVDAQFGIHFGLGFGLGFGGFVLHVHDNRVHPSQCPCIAHGSSFGLIEDDPKPRVREEGVARARRLVVVLRPLSVLLRCIALRALRVFLAFFGRRIMHVRIARNHDVRLLRLSQRNQIGPGNGGVQIVEVDELQRIDILLLIKRDARLFQNHGQRAAAAGDRLLLPVDIHRVRLVVHANFVEIRRGDLSGSFVFLRLVSRFARLCIGRPFGGVFALLCVFAFPAIRFAFALGCSSGTLHDDVQRILRVRFALIGLGLFFLFILLGGNGNRLEIRPFDALLGGAAHLGRAVLG